MEDYYKILGIEKNASDEEIRKAYKKRAMETHPDRNDGSKESEEEFKKVNEANSILSDPDKRINYDRYGSESGDPFQGGGFSGSFNDIFRGFGFDGGNRNRKRIENLVVNLSLTLEEIYVGANKKIKVNQKKKCEPCKGTGGDLRKCSQCNGSGQVSQHQQTPFGRIVQVHECPTCQGQGQTVRTACTHCGGNGWNQSPETISIDVPKGVHDGMSLVMHGNGNFSRGGEIGDLIIQVHEIPHPIFKREGDDLIITVNISIPDAVLGSKIKQKLVSNNTLDTKIEPGPARILQFPRAGMPSINDHSYIGTLYVNIVVDVPTKITDDEKVIFENLKKSKSFK